MNDRRLFLALAGASLPHLTAAASGDDASPATPLPSLVRATAWLNSPPLSAATLRGKVLLIDFWTYSCINWRREFPYVRAWAAKYQGGLVVIGVHSPEFEFEKNVHNVRRAVQDIGVTYPVALDSDLSIWRAFANAYWPALYFIDARGGVRHHHFGEGDYAESERAIQRLLADISPTAGNTDLVDPMATGAEAPPDWRNLKSPENYAGYGRTNDLVSSGVIRNKRSVYDAPARLRLGQWALAGWWTLREQAAVLDGSGGRIAYCFHARDLHMVMGPMSTDKPVPFRISLEGKPPGPARGVDVDEQGRGALTSHRMYQLVRQPGAIGDRRFEIEFEQPGAEVFSFTFG